MLSGRRNSRNGRQKFLDAVSKNIENIPKRNTLVIAGDFQSEVTPQKGHVGRSTCLTPFHVDREALDPGALNLFLEAQGTVALNTWIGPAKPTQFNQSAETQKGTGQIDFILTRFPTADLTAKQVKVMPPPVGLWRQRVGHMRLQASIRVMTHHLLPKRKNHGTEATERKWTMLPDKWDRQLRRFTWPLRRQSRTNPPDASDIQSILNEQCARIFPPAVKPVLAHNEEIRHLWQLRKQAEHTPVGHGRIFRAWRAVARHWAAARKAKQHCYKAKREATQGDQRKVYQVVKKLAPWKPRDRVMVKDKQGNLLTKSQEHQALVEFSRDLFAPRCTQVDRTDNMLPLVFTIEQIEGQLSLTKVGKAAPPDTAPASACKICASKVAPLLQLAYSKFSHDAGLCLPERWTNAWIIWLPKPGKEANAPASLRPIGLMTPDAKEVLVGLLRDQL